MGYRRPHIGVVDDVLKVAYGKNTYLLCRISDDVLAGVAILVSLINEVSRTILTCFYGW